MTARYCRWNDSIYENPGIKKILCDRAGGDRSWLSKIRPWYGHDDHMHVRLHCPRGARGCLAQKPTPAGDGCGASLAYWLSPLPWKQRSAPKEPEKPPKDIMLSDLPAACTDILAAGSTPLDPSTEHRKRVNCRRNLFGFCR